MTTKFQPNQIEGLAEAYKDIEKLNINTRGIKIAAWVTAIATYLLAIVGVITLVMPLLNIIK